MIVVISLLMVIFLSHFYLFNQVAEKKAVETTFKNIQKALSMQLQLDSISFKPKAQWAGKNPLELIDKQQINYYGHLSLAKAEELPVSAWAFDTQNGILFYRQECADNSLTVHETIIKATLSFDKKRVRLKILQFYWCD